MLAALDGLLAEMREERPQAEASGKVVDTHLTKRTTAQRNICVEAHAAVSQNNLPGGSSVGQMGAFRLNELRSLDIRHKNAFDFEAREVSK